MKTNQKLKRLVAVSSFALLASAYPAFAQESVNPDTTRSSEMQQSQTDGRIMDEPAGADNSTNWSWLGLLGLAGLFGLKRHHDVRDENYRTART